jgi:CelD/BcsL family acetyltransferase involved in cellulose biosynthesis
MKINIIRKWNELSRLEPEWNALLSSSQANAIFLTWEWIQAWRTIVGEEKKLFIVTITDDQGRLLGVAPFYEYRFLWANLIPYRALRILADYSTGSEYGDWIVDSAHEQQVMPMIAQGLAQSRDWDVIWMPRISGWSNALNRITQALSSAGLIYHSRPSLFSSFPLPDSLEKYEAGFSAKKRQQLRRNRRHLMSRPGVDIIRCSNQNELPNFLESLFDLHHRRRMLLDDPGCFIRRPAEADFYRNFLPRALKKGWLRLAALTQDGTIEAIQLGYVYNGDFLQMQEGFNPDYVNGAGNVLRHIVIEDCITEGLNNYDFLGGYSEHKRRWKALERFGHDLLIGRPSLKVKLLFMREVWPSGRYITEFGLFDGNS